MRRTLWDAEKVIIRTLDVKPVWHAEVHLLPGYEWLEWVHEKFLYRLMVDPHDELSFYVFTDEQDPILVQTVFTRWKPTDLDRRLAPWLDINPRAYGY